MYYLETQDRHQRMRRLHHEHVVWLQRRKQEYLLDFVRLEEKLYLAHMQILEDLRRRPKHQQDLERQYNLNQQFQTYVHRH